jgi:signal transduction histidine kinase
VTPAQLEEALAESDEYAARDAVRAVAEILRRPMHGDEDRIGLALALSEAAPVHPSARVREEIAKACDAFPDPFFDATLTVLAADGDPYVREHARRAADRHATKKKERHKRDAQQRELDVALGALSAMDAMDDADGHAERHAPGPSPRRLAERAVRRGVEHFMAQLDHELGKVHESIFESLGRLEVETDRDAPSPAALRRDVGDLQNRVAYLFSMLRRSRAYSQRITPRFERTDVAALVGEARAQLEARVRDRAMLAFEADVEPGLVMDVDRHAMLQALQNLFQNAVEAYAESAPARTVRVVARGRRAGSEVVLEVIDRGKGMSDGARACAFTPFKSDKPGGSGLGLMVARTMIEEVHDGSLTFESERGVGTCMTVVVPARRAGARGARDARDVTGAKGEDFVARSPSNKLRPRSRVTKRA